MKKEVFKVEQLPDYSGEDAIVWNVDAYIITLTRQPNGKVKLSGEYLEYDEDEEDWEGKPLTRNECIDIAAEYDLVLPTDQGIKRFTELYKKRENVK